MPRATPASSPGPSNEARSATANSAVVPSVHVAAPTATPNLAPLNLSSAEAEAPRNTTQTTMQSSGSFGQSSGEGDRHRGDSHQSSTLLGNISGRMDGAASQKAENIRVFISQLDSALQTMNQEKSSNIKLRISLERGEVIRIQLSLRGSKLKTSIHTESDNVRQLLRSSWSEVSRALSAKGVEAEMPEFDGGSENSSHREKSFAERTEAELAQLQRNGRTSDSAQDSPNKPNELRDSRIFSRIA
ncbi:MAG: flagellar hook-length control protein FliK [Opitutales bacterium]|nr:flagellar hook-length control protein FliK [Opitutales bacterium]